MIPSVADPTLALRWLAQARRGLVAAQALLLGLTLAASPIQVRSSQLIAVLAIVVVVDALESIRVARRPPGPALVYIHLAFDVAALTVILSLTGGAENPLQAFYLVHVALAAIILPTRGAWLTTLAALTAQALVVFGAPDLPGLDDLPHTHLAHLVGHVLAFDIAGVAVTAFVGRLSSALRASEADRAQKEKLAALGTLAAGTAHALATPMGAIELLAEEVGLDVPEHAPGRAALRSLRGELRRCRAILDRMLAGEEGAEGETEGVPGQVAEWAEEWRAAQDEAVDLVVEVAALDGTARGGPDGWRDALWTILDNARTAGEPIAVRLSSDPHRWLLTVDDSGPPVPVEHLSRAGQPFFTAWSGRKGTGLGLYVARTYARAAGGDLQLAPGGRGARATLTMVRA